MPSSLIRSAGQPNPCCTCGVNATLWSFANYGSTQFDNSTSSFRCFSRFTYRSECTRRIALVLAGGKLVS